MNVSQTYLDQQTYYVTSSNHLGEKTMNHFCSTCDHLAYWKFYGADGVLLDAQWLPHSCDQVVMEWVMER